MAARNVPQIINPSFPTVRERPRTFSKPLPPLPASNYVSVVDTNQQRGHIFRTSTAALLLPLDSRSIDHASTVMLRSLEQLHLPKHPWERVLSNILGSITSQYPHVIGLVDTPHLEKFRQNESSDNGKKADDYHKIKRQTIYCICIDIDTNGQPSTSSFIPDQFFGRPLLQLPKEYGSEFDIEDNKYKFIGGTVLLKGADTAVLENAAVVLGIVMFVVYNLTLESCVLRDHQITRQTSNKKAKTTTPANKTTKPIPQIPSNKEEKNPAGLFGWMKPSAKRNSVRKLIDIFSGGKASEINTPTSINKRNSARIAPVQDASPFMGSSRLTNDKLQLSDFFSSRQLRASQSFLSELGISESEMHHFSNLLKSINQAVLSSSPGIVYPPPRLIVRLHEDEEAINAIGADAWISLRPNNAAVIRTLSGFRAMELQRMVGIPARQRLSRKSTARTGDTWSTTSNATSTTSVPQSITAYSTLRNPKMTVETGLELNYLNLKTNDIHSIINHQSLAVSFSSFSSRETMVRCEGPTIYAIDFYRYSSRYHPTGDKTLGEVIMNWCNEAQPKAPLINKASQSTFRTTASTSDFKPLGSIPEKPPKPNGGGSKKNENQDAVEQHVGCPKCHGPIQDHIFSFCHGSSRINVTIGMDRTRQNDKGETVEEKEEFGTDHDDMGVIMWTACKVCKEQLKPLPMSLPTYKYSFGKYLELLLYDKEFMPPKAMCEHSTDRHSVLRCFQHKGVIIQFDYEDIELFEMRVPRLQVVLPDEVSAMEDSDNIEHGSSSDGGAEPQQFVKEVAIELNACEESLFQAEGEVDSFFSAVDRHIKLLQEYLVAEDKLERQSATFFLGQSKAQGLRSELDQLQILFNQERENLLRGLDKLVGDEMNDFNRWFSIKVKSIMDSLLLWQETNCPELDIECIWDPIPDWMKSETVHLFPGSSVPVREDEPSSIIAHTLSSKDYQEELEQKPIVTRSLQSSSTSSAAALFTESPESKTPEEKAIGETPSSESMASITSTKQKNAPVYRELLHGFYSTVGRETVAIGNSLATAHAPASLRTTLLETIRDMNVTERLGSRLTNFNPAESNRSDRDLELLSNKLALTSQQNTSLPTGMDDRVLKSIEADVAMGMKDISRKVLDVGADVSGTAPGKIPKRSNSLITEVKVTSVINETASRVPPSGQPSSVKSSSDTGGDSKSQGPLSPHIKHKYVHNGTQFSCTVYFAREFDELRQRCGIEKLIIQSLSRCDNWSASGGKSKSTFFKTKDNRLVLKQMVSSWNVAERDALLRFAPKYFAYLKRSAGAPSVLAKIFGFYTIKIRKLAEDKTTLKMDILVMEHLFYGQNISRRFDLKGIQGRHVDGMKKSAELTLWDGDWVEGFRATLMVHAQSKAIIEQALQNDATFLAECNIMDYSLLVGIDDEKKEMIVGIVDFIGTFTWFKKLESTSKSALQPHKEVTVLSPNKYKTRFCETILDYFLGIPDKWLRLPKATNGGGSRKPTQQGKKTWSWWFIEDDMVEEWNGLVPLPYSLV
ncbi:hypothetical protein INT44_000089 [Umbelopsis vinacea]|uniref:PIPK domain-containing protein n=1 Tax=Umbelopsis vinacea TaxID=44442 RepID=A0A8H7U8Y5_9FUNG|nr:hypothetical protein INT44_000089 [Umbelopsis vinacea]